MYTHFSYIIVTFPTFYYLRVPYQGTTNTNDTDTVVPLLRSNIHLLVAVLLLLHVKILLFHFAFVKFDPQRYLRL